MANKLILKNGAGIPAPEKLEVAELALDTEDGSLYSKLGDGSVVQLNDGADDVDLSDYVTEAPIDTKQYARQDGDWSEIVIPDGGTGSSVHIGDEPENPSEGQQWLELSDGDAKMWVYDGAVWLEQPSTGGGSSDVDLSNYYTKTEANAAFKPASYSAPVDSVNGKAGEVVLEASDVGALPDTYTPPEAPVTSVNNKTGIVNLTAADVGASTFKGEVLTQAQYDALTPDPNTVYFIK